MNDAFATLLRGGPCGTVSAFLAAVLMFLGGGCQSVVWLPREADAIERQGGTQRLEYRLADGRRLVEERDASGRTIAFQDVSSGPEGRTDRIILEAVDASEKRYLVIALDGVPFDLAKELHDEGRLPAFYPPTPMVTVYPAMSDIAFARILESETPSGFEAAYYDREKGRVTDGNAMYLAGANEPWSALLDYRFTNFWSAMQYLSPGWFFQRELENVVRNFERSDAKAFYVYLASTAGMGTRMAGEGYNQALLTLDRLARQLMIESKGNVTVTLIGDHGHTLTPATRAPIERFLKGKGWRVVSQLDGRDKREVVPIRFGLVTYAAFHTDSPAELARALVEMPEVTLASYPEGDATVVVSRQGTAEITRRGNRYRHRIIEGDPLGLCPIIKELSDQGKVDGDGYIDDQALFLATVDFEYPDPLKRLWESFRGLARHPADVIVSLRDDRYFGRKGFEGATPVASTHGALNRANSVTFVMSTIGTVGGPIRVDGFREAASGLGIPPPSDHPGH